MLWRRGDNRSVESRVEGTQRLRSCFCFFIFSLLLLAFAPAGARAEQIIPYRGVDVRVEGVSEVKWVAPGTDHDELILIFKDTDHSKVNSVSVGADADVRVLLVGGGGAGGTVRSSSQTGHPGGGGGGAGELVDRDEFQLKKDNLYTLSVGAGGAADGVSGTASVGQDGEDSFIQLNGADFIRVKGGGGGGGEDVGRPGGSGGGGSNTDAVGGESVKNEVDGKGNKGGTSAKRYAAGGGGAIGAGGDGTTVSGVGGSGFESNIIPDDVKFYGGGGGGGTTMSGAQGGAGGAGGGGKGGGAASSDSAAPTPGTDGLGGGGGGGGRYKVGAKGGSGVIIIRISKVKKELVWKAIDVVAGGNPGKIFVDENASYEWKNGDLVITYTDVNSDGGLRFFDPNDPTLPPVWANARVLLVGGGGGGGMVDVYDGGVGAGGGAGGFIDERGFIFDNSIQYDIAVGKGGAGGAANDKPGENGTSSSVRTNGVNVTTIEAFGGGGGGARSDGRGSESEKVGSGGGGSMSAKKDEFGKYERVGGTGTAGQGSKGGDGLYVYRGAGGGGAGGDGDDATRDTGAGKGGDGKTSDITGNSEWYAGGGGGAYINPNDTLNIKYPGAEGGRGGGGSGAGVDGGSSGRDFNPKAATDGEDGKGGGGGGGVSYVGAPETGGRGGHGVVIIRLSGFVVKNVPYPEIVPEAPFTYDGNAHTGVVKFFAYELKGVPVATNANTYEVWAHLEEGSPYTWPNGQWGDSPHKTWTINKLRVDLPGATSNFVYNATVQSPVATNTPKWTIDADGFAWTTNNPAGKRVMYCQLVDHGEGEEIGYKRVHANTYTVRAVLYTEGDVANFIWRDGSSDPKEYPWKIRQAPNAISNFVYTGYSLARLPSHDPKNQFDVAWGRETTITEYCKEGTGDWQGWGAAGPTEKGNYEVRVTIPECDDWQGSEATLPFGVWEKWSDIFTDRMEITVSGNTSGTTTLTNFPVAVRIQEPTKDGYSEFSGFSYARAGATGKEIHFFDTNGDPVEHDVDTWTTRGTSLVWVRVPALKNANTKLTMCWRRVNGIRLPDYDGTAVWTDYAGVWHMAKPEGGKLTDASGNGLDAFVPGGSSVEPVDGRFGKAVYVNSGNLLVDGYNELNNTTNFMFSGWYRNDKGTAANFNFAGTKMGKNWDFTPGWSFFMNTATKFGVSTANGWDGGTDISTAATVFQHLAYVVPAGNANRYSYYNGANQKSKTGDISVNALPLQLAGAKFSCDEVRLRKNAPANYAAWVKEEYNSLNNANYCKYGLVIRDELKCDWWTTTGVPKVTPEISKAGSMPTASKGSYTDAGSKVTYVCRDMETGTETTNALQGAIGYYQVTFDHENPTGYWPRPHTVGYYVIKAPNPTNDLGGVGGDSGRILLMNADPRSEYSVMNQGWSARSEAGVTRWETTAGDASDGTNNIMGGTSFELVRCPDKKVLWRLYDCRQGNTFPTNDNETLPASNCYLPPSQKTAFSITNEDVKAERRGDAGWLMMRNSTDASIYSSCFTNGIGTIYLDAVNSRVSVAGNANGYKLVLEIATETKDHKPPLDENCWEEDPDNPGETNWYAKAVWSPVTMQPTVVHGTTYSDKSATTELALAEATGGNKDHYFYRVHAPLVAYGPVRFRIRRTTTDTTAGSVDDGFILIDNIIVSVPPVSATLKPYGRFDPKLAGDATVGMGGAFSTPFPSVTGAAFPGRCTVTLPPGTPYAGQPPSSYISMAQMFYRWRYLGRTEDWRMAVLTDDGTDAMATADDLGVPADAGDLEFYFVSMMKTTYYQYVDYSRASGGKVSNVGYTEEITKKPSVMNLPEYGVTRLASGGTNWFVRVRDGASDWERMTLEIRGAFTNDCPMRLVADGTWRALLPVPTNVEGRCTFRFRGRNRQSAGAKDYALNETVFGGGAEEVELPRNGILSVGGAATPFTLDHVSNYIEFRLGADGSANPTWSASRAEYQNFNDWHDVWSSAESQKFSPGTNGVDTIAMRTENLDVTRWKLYGFEDDAWNEMFKLVNYNSPDYPKETFFQNHQTPSVWSGCNLTFVSKNLVAWVDPTKADTTSGMAAKLQGQGGGLLEYAKSNNPKGLETISFTARIGQSIGFDDISYAADNSRKANYTFLCPVSMSRMVSDNAKAGDMSVGGAVSLFAYYRESKGCYEFRATRAASGLELTLEMFKWHMVNGAMKRDRLCGQRFNTPAADQLRLWDDSGEVTPGYFGMFISAETTGSGTKLTGGVWKGNTNGSKTDMGAQASMFFSGSQASNGYGGLYYVDTAGDRLTSGAYGVAAKDCPAQFIRPRHIDAPLYGTLSGLATTTTYKPWPEGATGQYFKPSGNKSLDVYAPTATVVYDAADIAEGFWELGPQIETCANGLRTPVGLSQDVIVMLQEKNGGKGWFEAGRVPVSGYAFAEKTVQVHMTGDYNLRLTTGQKAVDAVIGEVKQRQWQGLDYENLSYSSDEFAYTQGVVASNDLRRAKETLLQPARGVVTKPLSVRSPVLHGLGKVSFAYEDADPNAQIWVQVATNNVEYNLTVSDGYTLSVKSVDRGEPEPVGTWVTVAKFGASEDCPDGPLGRSGVRTVYLGWHDQANAPVTGVFRVFIPPAVVEKAIVLATNATQNVDYGRINVTGMTVTDEPGVSPGSWRGWNLRTIGDGEDAERRMFLDDGLLAGDIGNGLTCGLNNSVNDIVDEDTEKAALNNPTIWSPTLETADGKSRSIGEVAFRARLYYADDARETETGGVVSLYGATSSTSENWTKLVDIPVTSSTFSNFTWVALGTTRYRAVKLEVSGAAAKGRVPDRDRVIVDEIVLKEKLDAKIGFEYVRPFRSNLYEPVVIEDIESPNEQPVVGESWGVQTKLRLEQLGKEVRGLEVYLTSYAGESPWGYGMWKDRAPEVRLVQVGEPGDGIFRSVGDTPESLVQALSSPGVVQYMVLLKYAGEGEETAVQQVEREDWTQPSWYWPVDYNEKNGGYADPDKFSPYAVIDTVSPGRAWINEVNWNNGPAKETHTEYTVKTNQFIEICVPSGIDMTGWYLRATDLNLNKWVMAKFGSGGVKSSKVTEYAVNNFEFMLLESPETNLAGGIRDAEGNLVETDGTWASDGPSGTADSGSLAFNRPWQFELVRPSGIVEHQIVVGGTNTMSQYSYGYIYDATNLQAKLDAETPSPKRFLAGDELARSADGRNFASFGVIGGNDEGNPPPGGDGTWSAPMKFTPGRLNEGQEIPAGWYLAPNGTNSWVTLTVVGDYLTQEVGGQSAKVIKLIVPQGTSTNVTYRTKSWYEVENLTVDGATVAEHQARYGQAWTYALTPTGQLCNVVATEGFDSGLDQYGLRGHPYESAVMKWLSEKYSGARAEDIQLAAYKGLGKCDQAFALGLVDMYWLDIPPVPENDAERANVEAGNTNWWFRGGVTDLRADQYYRTRHYGYGDITFTNSQVDIQLYISNAVSGVAHAPQYLQGINYEKSDAYDGAWVSETFQILGNLTLKPDPERKEQGYMPFRCFKFDEHSFTGPEDDPPFSSTIEILDPFSPESPGYSYGWPEHKGEGFYFKWTLTTNSVPASVETLKANDTYGD